MNEVNSVERPVRQVGRVRIKLAALLQKSFPVSSGGLTLTWEPTNLFPATGRYRTDWRMDCARWEGAARHYREDGTFWTVTTVHSYYPMRDLIRATELDVSTSGEVFPVSPNTPISGPSGSAGS